MHKSQVFFYILIAFIGGVFGGSFFNIPYFLALAVLMISVILIAIFSRKDSKFLNVKITLASFLMIFFILGVLRFNAVNAKQHLLSEIAKTTPESNSETFSPKSKHPIRVSVYGYINSEPEIQNDKQKFVFYAKAVETGPYNITADEQVLITVRPSPGYFYGQKLKIFGEPKIPKNSPDFDYKSYLAKDSIFTLMNYPEASESDITLSFYENFKIKALNFVFKIKSKFEKSLSRSIAEPNAAFIDGILLGHISKIPADLKNAFTRTSTSHILAVSGYNITVVAVVISWFFLLFFKRPTAFWFSLAGIVLFTILTGAQASVMRAAIMGALVLLASRTSRLSDPRNAIVLAGAAMIFINPQILRHDIGFQLSFAATFGLIYVSPMIEKYFAKVPNIFSSRETLIMTVSAQFFVLPLLLYYFKNLSLTSIPANIIVLPTIPLAMLSGFLAGVAGLMAPLLGELIGYFAWLVTSAELWIIKLFAKPSWAAVPFSFKWYEIFLVYFLIILFLVKLNYKNKKVTVEN